MRVLALATIFVALIVSSAWAAGEKVALLIGNSDYRHVSKLRNPANDVQDLSASLGAMGFDVRRVENVDFSTMRNELRDFADRSAAADVALIFFAGHGIEVAQQNYLIPVDARMRSDRDIAFEAVPLQMLMDAASPASQLGLVMLDACRNDPFIAKIDRTDATRSIGRGLGKVEPESGLLVSYAARAGTVAQDGKGRNSPYTRALLEHIQEPGLDVQFLFRRVRDSVMNATDGQQQPFTYGSLPGREVALLPGNANPQTRPDRTPEAIFWEKARLSDRTDMLRTFLELFPQGKYEKEARARLALLLADQLTDEEKRSRALFDSKKAGYTKWMTPQEYNDYFYANRSKRYPKHVEGVSLNGDRYYRAQWVRYRRGQSWYTYYGMSDDVFDKRNRDLKRQGYRLLFSNSFKDIYGKSVQATWFRP